MAESRARKVFNRLLGIKPAEPAAGGKRRSDDAERLSMTQEAVATKRLAETRVKGAKQVMALYAKWLAIQGEDVTLRNLQEIADNFHQFARLDNNLGHYPDLRPALETLKQSGHVEKHVEAIRREIGAGLPDDVRGKLNARIEQWKRAKATAEGIRAEIMKDPDFSRHSALLREHLDKVFAEARRSQSG